MFDDHRLNLAIKPILIDSGTWGQIGAILNIPNLERLCLMPDAHKGFDMPIGGVALMDGLVSPAFVGNDIGCGMFHYNTGLTLKDMGLLTKNRREKLLIKIMSAVPLGFEENTLGHKSVEFDPFIPAVKDNKRKDFINIKASKQAGTLGSGNHFIEIGVNSKDEVGITIHTGSRKPGFEIGQYWMKRTKQVGDRFGKLYLLDASSEECANYLIENQWAEEFAYLNRLTIFQRILEVLGIRYTNKIKDSLINENHNHVVPMEDNKFLHRKGATPADKGQFGIIPTNQADGVYITSGLGNEEFLCSASHGAGRRLGRKAAQQKIDRVRFNKQMKGIVCSSSLANETNKRVLEEAPDAYKDPKTIIDAQNGILVDILDHFRPLIVAKGI